MIEPMWLKTTVQLNGIPKGVEPSAIDVAVKLNEVIEHINLGHWHMIDAVDSTEEDRAYVNPVQEEEHPRGK